MKKVIIAIMVVFAFAVVAIAAGPATIDLSKEWGVAAPTKKAVMFPHDKHQAKNQCTDCHLKAEGGALKNQKTGAEFKPANIKGMKNAAHDEFCWECHVKKNVPQGKSCTKCHK